MNQIFTMENRLFHHFHPLKNGCLEFQVGEIEAPHQTILNFWKEFLDSVFVAGDTFAVMFASPSVRQFRSRVIPKQKQAPRFWPAYTKDTPFALWFFFSNDFFVNLLCCFIIATSYSYTHLLITTILLRCYFVKTSCHQVICIHHQGSC